MTYADLKDKADKADDCDDLLDEYISPSISTSLVPALTRFATDISSYPLQVVIIHAVPVMIY